MSVKLIISSEHQKDTLINQDVSDIFSKQNYEKRFAKKHHGNDGSSPYFSINRQADDEENYTISTSYFIGLDWVETNKSAVYVAPKLNDKKKEVDFVSMLLSSLRHETVNKELEGLFVVKWDKPTIEITQKQDLLTPFLVVEYLSLLKHIVRKGLKKSYYKVEQNLQGRVRGKVQVSKTIKQNAFKNKNLFTYCSFDEFGINNKENRLLKKALQFIRRYLPTYAQLNNHKDLQDTFNYINPSFTQVSDQIEITEIKHTKTNVFYKEYEQALYLAKLILKRFGYNISNAVNDIVQTPPFWIDMSKLFELYVFSKLKEVFPQKNEVKFQQKIYYRKIDYILKSNDDQYKMVIDAKYKPQYTNCHPSIEDLRQISAYARMTKVYSLLEVEHNSIIDCLIIYPDQSLDKFNFENVIFNHKDLKVNEYVNIFKIGISLPEI